MRTLSFLSEPLPPGDGVGLATHDPRFARLARLAESDRIEEAAVGAAELVEQSIYDVRLLIYVVHAAFLESGVARLAELFDGLDRMLATSWDRIGPSEKRDLHVDKSLAWFFDRVEATIAYHQAKKDDTWSRWLDGADAISESLTALDGLVRGRGAGSQTMLEEPSAKLRRVLREMMRETEQPDATVPVPPSEPANRKPEVASSLETLGLELVGSDRFRELLSKLHAFEVLINQGDYRKASLVAADVQATIDDFDPREYFPKLFAGFSTLLSEHVDRIAPHWEQKDSVSWRMLEQFYRVDLKAFVGPES